VPRSTTHDREAAAARPVTGRSGWHNLTCVVDSATCASLHRGERLAEDENGCDATVAVDFTDVEVFTEGASVGALEPRAHAKDGAMYVNDARYPGAQLGARGEELLNVDSHLLASPKLFARQTNAPSLVKAFVEVAAPRVGVRV
jgi:hypothetical protein